MKPHGILAFPPKRGVVIQSGKGEVSYYFIVLCCVDDSPLVKGNSTAKQVHVNKIRDSITVSIYRYATCHSAGDDDNDDDEVQVAHSGLAHGTDSHIQHIGE